MSPVPYLPPWQREQVRHRLEHMKEFPERYDDRRLPPAPFVGLRVSCVGKWMPDRSGLRIEWDECVKEHPARGRESWEGREEVVLFLPSDPTDPSRRALAAFARWERAYERDVLVPRGFRL